MDQSVLPCYCDLPIRLGNAQHALIDGSNSTSVDTPGASGDRLYMLDSGTSGVVTMAAEVDACHLLDVSALSRFEGLDRAAPSASFGNWKCEWGGPADSGTPAVTTYFFRDKPPLTLPGREPVNLAGRAGLIVPGGFDDSSVPVCLVEVVQRGFTARTGQDRVELLMVSVYGSQPMETLCQVAADLTANAVPKLP